MRGRRASYSDTPKRKQAPRRSTKGLAVPGGTSTHRICAIRAATSLGFGNGAYCSLWISLWTSGRRTWRTLTRREVASSSADSRLTPSSLRLWLRPLPKGR